MRFPYIVNQNNVNQRIFHNKIGFSGPSSENPAAFNSASALNIDPQLTAPNTFGFTKNGFLVYFFYSNWLILN